MPEPEMARSSAQDATSLHRGADAAVFLATFGPCLHTHGLTAALAQLNRRTRFRFSGLYRVVPPRLHNVSLFDRENPSLNLSGTVCGLSDTYCSIVSDTGQPFRVRDAMADPRLRAHPARESVQSYVGVPVRLPGGGVLGTLCHYDGRPRLLPAGELAVMHAVAPLLAPWLASASAMPER